MCFSTSAHRRFTCLRADGLFCFAGSNLLCASCIWVNWLSAHYRLSTRSCGLRLNYQNATVWLTVGSVMEVACFYQEINCIVSISQKTVNLLEFWWFFELLWISFLLFSFWLKDCPYLCIKIMLTDLGFEVCEKFHNLFCYFFLPTLSGCLNILRFN